MMKFWFGLVIIIFAFVLGFLFLRYSVFINLCSLFIIAFVELAKYARFSVHYFI